MTDNTNPPQGGQNHPYGGPQGPHSGQQGPYGAPQQNPYAGPQGQPGSQGQPGQLWPQQGAPDYPQGQHYGQGQPQYGQGGQPQYEQVQYGPGQPQYGQGGQPPFGGQPHVQQWQPEPKRRGKLIPLVAVLAVLAVISGGGIFAYAKLNGGGHQPASVLPANSVAYARIDLNPSAGQRVAALRFLMKFPSAKEKIGLTSDNDDLRQKLFDLIKKDAGDDLADVDFDKDIKPWLGDRAGVAAVPSGDKVEPVVAVQVKDEGKATKGLDKLFAKEDEPPKRAFADGYVLLSDEQAALDSAVAASKGSSLEDNDKFDKDMSALGEQGFASFWADTKGLALAAGKRLTDQQRAALPEGSAAAVLRFDSQYVELKGVVHGDQTVKVNSKTAGDVIGKLPDTTAGAIALSDGENLVSTVWSQIEKSSGQAGINLGDLTKNFADEYGLSLPDDLKPLLGKNLAIAIDKDSAERPKIAAKMETDPAKAEAVVDKLTDLLRNRTSMEIPIEKAKDGSNLVIATDKGYAEQVLKGGNLGQTEAFKQAVPDTKNAVMVGYVDFQAIGSLSSKVNRDKDYAALRSAGISTRVTGDGEGEFTLRVVAN